MRFLSLISFAFHSLSSAEPSVTYEAKEEFLSPASGKKKKKNQLAHSRNFCPLWSLTDSGVKVFRQLRRVSGIFDKLKQF